MTSADGAAATERDGEPRWAEWESQVQTGSLKGRSYRVRSLEGPSSPVIVLHELFGPDKDTMALAAWLHVEHGFSVHVPALFGEYGTTSRTGLLRSMVCLRREFAAFRTGRTSPIVAWLRQLVAEVSAGQGGVEVGIIGMCMTGGFALALAAEPDTGAAVASQPSLPVAVLRPRRVQADLGLSPEHVPERDPAPLMVLRSRQDRICPRLRVEVMAGLPLADVDGVDSPRGRIPVPDDVVVRQGTRGPLLEPPGSGHSILTADLVPEVREVVGAWLAAHLAADG